MLRKGLAIGMLGSLVILFLIRASSFGGLIEVISVEDKGEVITIIGHNEFKSSMTVTLHWPDWGELSGTYRRGNREVFVIDKIIEEHFFNVYPVAIEIPQPVDLQQLITIPFFMATGQNPLELGPLPDGAQVTSAEMQDGSGTWHPANIYSFFDVFVDLPIEGPHGETYTWDLDRFATTQGNFYLAEVTMSAGVFAAPEPSTLALILLGGLGWSALRRKRLS